MIRRNRDVHGIIRCHRRKSPVFQQRIGLRLFAVKKSVGFRFVFRRLFRDAEVFAVGQQFRARIQETMT